MIFKWKVIGSTHVCHARLKDSSIGVYSMKQVHDSQQQSNEVGEYHESLAKCDSQCLQFKYSFCLLPVGVKCSRCGSDHSARYCWSNTSKKICIICILSLAIIWSLACLYVCQETKAKELFYYLITPTSLFFIFINAYCYQGVFCSEHLEKMKSLSCLLYLSLALIFSVPILVGILI